MAFGSGTWFDVASNGSDTLNGGGFDTGAASMATDLAATSATGTAPVVTSATYTFVTADTDRFLFIQAGTGWIPGWYQVASVSAGAATLIATVGSVVLYNGATPKNLTAGCHTSASPTGGTWSMDYSRGSPFFSFTDMVIGATTTQFTSVAHPAGPNWIGNFIAVTGGTGFTVQWVEVTAFTLSGLLATCDKSLGTTLSTGGTGGLGGSLASPGKAALLTAGLPNVVAVKGSTTYTMSSSSNVAGGRMAPNSALTIFGWSTNRYPRNLDANRPVFKSNGNTYSLITVGAPSTSCHCIEFQITGGNTTIKAFDDGAGGWGNSDLWNCLFNGVSVGADVRTNSAVNYCWFKTCTNAANCFVADNTTTVKNCVFTDCTQIAANAKALEGVTVYNCGTSSTGIFSGARVVDRLLFHTITGTGCVALNGCYAVENSIFWNVTASGAIGVKIVTDNTANVNNCGFGSNTQDVNTVSGFPGYKVSGKIVLTADPCTAASSGDFSLNGTAGGGALLKSLGFPVTFANALTTQGLDVGPAQTPAVSAVGTSKLAGLGGGRAA